jgi:hypothetical protein
MNFLKNIIYIFKRIKNEDVAIEETQLIDEIKWFAYLLNLIILILHTNMTYQLLE